MCGQGHYCEKGTSAYLSTRNKCAIGYFCPVATSDGGSADIKCPRLCSSSAGASNMVECEIAASEVCDKDDINSNNPWEDQTYYQTFSYTLLDGSDTVESFDSTASTSATGEVQVVEKVIPINESSSTSYFVNDTIEVFRSCPTYGNASSGVELTVIGRNFRNTSRNYCRLRLCHSGNLGPNTCVNEGGELGGISNYTEVVPATFLSTTRVLCPVPPLIYNFSWTVNWRSTYGSGACKVANNTMNYVRTADTGGLEYITNLYVTCTSDEVDNGYCTNVPESGMKLNPCLTAQLLVEISNNGDKFSGEGLYYAHTSLDTSTYANNVDYNVSGTYAVYTYVVSKYFPTDAVVVAADTNLCMRSMYAEEGTRTREQGWFKLTAMQVARISMDLTHLPTDMIYGDDYRLGIFARPSRCDLLYCDSGRNILPLNEYLPCTLPMVLPGWFTDSAVKKQQVVNLTILALDDMIFKLEFHIMYSLFYPFVDYFKNTTTVEIIQPARANVTSGLSDPETRLLSPYVSWEEQEVVMEYFFGAVYYYDDMNSVSEPLNLPPTYSDFARGRALLSMNSTYLNSDTPYVQDDYDSVYKGEAPSR